MTPRELDRIATILYSGNWIGPLSHGLGVRDITVRRWAQGQRAIPSDLGPSLVELAVRRIAEIQALVDELAPVKD